MKSLEKTDLQGEDGAQVTQIPGSKKIPLTSRGTINLI